MTKRTTKAQLIREVREMAKVLKEDYQVDAAGQVEVMKCLGRDEAEVSYNRLYELLYQLDRGETLEQAKRMAGLK